MSTSKLPEGVTVVAVGGGVVATGQFARISRRHYFSYNNLWAANCFAVFAEAAENGPKLITDRDVRHRAYVSASILSSVAFLEAAVNEFFKDVADEQEGFISSIDEDCRKLIKALWDLTEGRNRSPFSTLDKCQAMLTFCRKEQFSTSSSPYQNADLAIKLRNELTHYKPGPIKPGKDHPLSGQLLGKFAENPFAMPGADSFFPDKCLGSPCARWVFNSVKALADEFFRRLDVVPHYERAEADDTEPDNWDSC